MFLSPLGRLSPVAAVASANIIIPTAEAEIIAPRGLKEEEDSLARSKSRLSEHALSLARSPRVCSGVIVSLHCDRAPSGSKGLARPT